MPTVKPEIQKVFRQPFSGQVDYFRRKLNLPTERWDDVLKHAHDRAFMVAGAAKADLLNDLRGAVDKAISEGESLDKFRERFRETVARHGWHGWTGEESEEGEAWRTRVIYQTNLSTSYAAGRYKQLNDPDLAKRRPYWKYQHSGLSRDPRPEHLAWSGMVLHKDDPWWTTHYPPNDWGCQCYVVAVPPSAYQGDRAPEDGTHRKRDSQGNLHALPKGVGLGWDYAPGAKNDTSLRELVQDKLIKYPAAIGKALSRDINRYINATEDIAGFARRVMQDKQAKENLWLGFVENAEPIQRAINEDLTGYLVLLPADGVRHVEKRRSFDGGDQRAVQPGDFADVMDDLLNYDEIIRGRTTRSGNKTFVISKTRETGKHRLVFEVLGKQARAVSLLSMVIKTSSK